MFGRYGTRGKLGSTELSCLGGLEGGLVLKLPLPRPLPLKLPPKFGEGDLRLVVRGERGFLYGLFERRGANGEYERRAL